MANIGNTLDDQEEKIKKLNEKIQYTYRKHVGFIMKKEMEYNLNRFKNEDNNNKIINLISNEKAYTDKEGQKNEHNNNPTLDWNSKLTTEFIEECIETEIGDNDNDNNNNNSNADAIKLSKELREDLKKHKEVYEHIKEAQREAVFEDL